MGALVPFAYGDALVRVVEVNAQPWWVAGDVAKVLGYKSFHMLRLLDADEKGIQKVDTLGGEQEMAIISESGLYHAIIKSRRPEAKAFRKWVTSEVLPTIRRTGQYQAAPSPEDRQPSALFLRGGRGRLSSIDVLGRSCRDDIDWVRMALRDCIETQDAICAEFNRRIAMKGHGPISRSAFSRFVMREAESIKRLDERLTAIDQELMIDRATLARMSPDEQDDAFSAAAQVVRARLIKLVDQGDLDARQTQLTALALERMDAVIGPAGKKRSRRDH